MPVTNTLTKPAPGVLSRLGISTFRAEVEGTTARAYVDGVLIDSFTVATVLAGSVGFAFGTDGPDASTGMVINEFRAGPLG